MIDRPQKQAVSICETATDASGNQVGFVVEYDDGSRAGVQCDAVRLPGIVNALIDLGATAARQRASVGGSGGAIHVIPREALSVGASQGFGHSTVVFIATTAEGPPIHLALTPDLVRSAIQALEKALLEPPPSAASVMN